MYVVDVSLFSQHKKAKTSDRANDDKIYRRFSIRSCIDLVNPSK